MSRPSGNQQETPTLHATMPVSLPDKRGTCRRIPDSLQAPAGDLRKSATVPDSLLDLRAPARDSQTVFNGAKTVRAHEGDL
ncbi:hypothetical protein DPMN_097230 [Dreissena polymorpha]|uniref:Uncharacterized protein n=1 Tax=Dreissena polymorpha TaxID=45954 RepID=A0A9D4LCK7_DREPO|nr:hypothetical protein DPMN_097230 [Dreissena polymorpha]